MVKGIDNAFDHMEWCFFLHTEELFQLEIGMFFQEVTFITGFPGSNFMLPTFLTGGKWNFQVANLLLATVNSKPCMQTVKPDQSQNCFST